MKESINPSDNKESTIIDSILELTDEAFESFSDFIDF